MKLALTLLYKFVISRLENNFVHPQTLYMENHEKFFNELYPDFGKSAYREIYRIFLRHLKPEFKKFPKKEVKRFIFTIANGTYFAYAVVNYKTVKRPEPDPTSNQIAAELKKIYGRIHICNVLRDFEGWFWIVLDEYFKVDLQGDVCEYQEFLNPTPYMSYSFGMIETKNRGWVSSGY